MSPPDNVTICESVISDIDQLNGNTSEHTGNDVSGNLSEGHSVKPINSYRVNNASVAHHLPVVTVCNMRSLFPKIQNFKTDFLERQVDFSLCCEVWEKSESKKHKADIEQMLELEIFVNNPPSG